MNVPKRTILHLICFSLTFFLSACGDLTEHPSETIFDTSLDKVKGGVRLAPFDTHWDGFGEAVDIYGNILVVGASEWNHYESGSVHVYRQSNGEWHEEVQLTANDRDVYVEQASGEYGGQRFGTAVAVGDDTIVVGAPGYVQQRDDGYNGAVYIYEYTSQTWSEVQKLTPNQTSQDNESNGMKWLDFNRMHPRVFGSLVALDGNRLAVGGDADGSVYVYNREESGWQEQAQLSIPMVSGRDYYPSFISLFGDTLVVSAFYLPPQPEQSSFLTGNAAVYVYERTGKTWKETFRFMPDDGKVDYLFTREINLGASIALGGDSGRANLLVIGMPGFPDWSKNAEQAQILGGPNGTVPNTGRQYGEVYIFAKEKNNKWVQQTTLKPKGWKNPPGPGSMFPSFPSHLEEDPNGFDEAAYFDSYIFPGNIYSETPEISFFGAGVSLDDNRLAVTSGFANVTYIFEQTDGNWEYQLGIRPQNIKIELWEDSSQSVVLNGNTLVVGTPSEFGNSAYVFDVCVPEMLNCE